VFSGAKENISAFIESAENQYCRLVLLVGESSSGKTETLQMLAADCGRSVTNANLQLSQAMLELTVKQRQLRLQRILERIADEAASPIFLDNIEILFDSQMKQDPLRLLQGISRNRTVVASWSGTYIDNKLCYAELGHPEYRCYSSVDARIVRMDEVSLHGL